MTATHEHVVSVSGGKDSTALYLRAMERGRPFTAVFADTGNEHEATYDYVRELPRLTGGPPITWVKADFTRQLARKHQFIARNWEKHGIPRDLVERALDVIAEPTGNPFLDLCLMKGRFPGAKSRFCTDELKLTPVFHQIQRPILDAGRTLITWQGVRAQESLARSILPMWQRLSDVVPYSEPKAVRLAYADGRAYAYRPLIAWTLEDVWAMHAKHGIARNHLYDLGMGRVGCMPCIMAKKGELRTIADRFPEHIDRIAQWEEIVSAAAKRGCATFFNLADDPTVDTTAGTHIGWDVREMGIRRRVAWSRTSRGGVQFDLMALSDFDLSCSSHGACE